MYIEILDPIKAKEILKSNRDYKIGQKIEGNYNLLSKVAIKNPEVFKFYGLPVKKEKNKEYRPKKNKKLQKGNKFKSKG